uniref:Uncharacterized protein n=1 Tax=Ixodes ricinus TaxID=34613 RepID=A0A6B0UWZ9_IXORI
MTEGSRKLKPYLHCLATAFCCRAGQAKPMGPSEQSFAGRDAFSMSRWQSSTAAKGRRQARHTRKVTEHQWPSKKHRAPRHTKTLKFHTSLPCILIFVWKGNKKGNKRQEKKKQKISYRQCREMLSSTRSRMSVSWPNEKECTNKNVSWKTRETGADKVSQMLG